jgi:hypothetical protein
VSHLTESAVAIAVKGPRRQPESEDMAMDDDEIAPGGRKLLRQHGNIQMWQEYTAWPHRGSGQLFRYFVGRPDERPKVFAVPFDAFDYFQRVSGAPTSPR